LLPAFSVLIGIILEAMVLRRFMRSQRREWRIPLLEHFPVGLNRGDSQVLSPRRV
jgi:hypothetical protein